MGMNRIGFGEDGEEGDEEDDVEEAASGGDLEVIGLTGGDGDNGNVV